MEDWTNRLRERRQEIIARLDQIGPAPDQASLGFAERPMLLQEILEIEQILVQHEATKAQLQETATLEAERAKSEGADFWFRRFLLSLAVGNAAAFLALASGLLQADDPIAAAKLIRLPLQHFGHGLLAAGAIPAIMWARAVKPETVSSFGLRADPNSPGHGPWVTMIATTFALVAVFVSAEMFAFGVLGSIRVVAVMQEVPQGGAQIVRAGSAGPLKSGAKGQTEGLKPAPAVGS